MSLLIKALEQAAESKHAENRSELSLEPLTSNDSILTEAGLSQPSAPQSSTSRSGSANISDSDVVKQNNQRAASTVFAAKTPSMAKPSNKLAWFALAALLMLISVGGAFYWYLQSLMSSEVVVRPLAAPGALPNQQEQALQEHRDQVQANQETKPEQSTTLDDASPHNQVETEQAVASASPAPILKSEQIKKTGKTNQRVSATSLISGTGDMSHLPGLSAKRTTKSVPLVFGEPMSPSGDGSVKITKKQPSDSVNPKLIEAYNAYNKGEDNLAQHAYKEVLQGDSRNTDALLGMATIAARQGRNDDAVGWYKKVLELEPRNHFAQAGIISLQQQDDPVFAETRLKIMIAQQPESASPYASLGDLYVTQNQWVSAQQAYFQAYHFEPNNAQYVFNLAVSLDHIGKPNLALPYYKRALEIVTTTDTASIDRAKLESRISQLQQ
jgi:tetratricopeptide (TPR) repeat protein